MMVGAAELKAAPPKPVCLLNGATVCILSRPLLPAPNLVHACARKVLRYNFYWNFSNEGGLICGFETCSCQAC